MSEVSEQMKTSEAAKRLGVSEATLRKYSQIVEKVTANPAYFSHVKNARRYSAENLADLKKMQEMNKEGKTLDQAAQELFAGEQAAEDSKADEFQELKKNLAQKDEEIAALKTQVAELAQAMAPAENKADPADDVLDLPDFDDLEDLGEAKEPDRPLTAEEKRAQVVADMGKSTEEVRRDIMDKVQENAQKARPEFRTLADMQLKSKKTPWWKKLFKG